MAFTHRSLCLKSLVVLVIVFSNVEVHGEVDCSVSLDGDYEIGCKVFTTCNKGQKTIISCPTGEVYNGAGGCDLRENVPLPCGGPLKDCKGRLGRFADHDNKCESFYACLFGRNYGTTFCQPGLVYDEARGLCDWPYNVRPPCGTRDILTTTG